MNNRSEQVAEAIAYPGSVFLAFVFHTRREFVCAFAASTLAEDQTISSSGLDGFHFGALAPTPYG